MSTSSNKNEIKQKRLKEMEETLSWLNQEMLLFEKYLEPYQLFDDDELANYVFDLLRRKLERKPVRAYFTRKVSAYILHEATVSSSINNSSKINHNSEIDEVIRRKFAFIVEVVIVIQYLHNQILDGKFGIKTEVKINRNLIASNILREILFRYIMKEVKPYFKDTDIAEMLYRFVAEMLLVVDLGQRIDKEFCNYEQYKKCSFPSYKKGTKFTKLIENLACVETLIEEVKKQTPSKKDFVDIYFKRIYLTNASLFVLMTELIGKITNYSASHLMDFAVCYGLALTIVNDNADFVPSEDSNVKEMENSKKVKMDTVAKKTTDAYSDLRNKNITLPLIFHLEKSPKREIQRYLETGEKAIIQDFQIQITQGLKESGALRKSMKEGRKFAKNGKQYLKAENPQTSLLFDMLEIANWNKYYRGLRDI